MKIYREEIVNDLGSRVSYGNYNEAQKINVSEWISRYGKETNAILGNTKKGRIITRLPQHNFGSITEYNIDTLPNSYLSRNGIEKFEITQDNKMYRGKDIMSRRFNSKILSCWCYALGIKYKKGIELWCKDIKIRLDKTGNNKSIKMLSGKEVIPMIKDIIFLTRYNKLEEIAKYSDKGIISPELHDLLYELLYDSTLSYEDKQEIFNNIKDKLYINHQIRDKVWTYPKYSIEYLIGLIKQIQSGEFFDELYIPVIYQLKKYPLECKDTHLKPMTPEQHIKTYDDYDLSQYYEDNY